METYHILIVEDDKEIREGIEIYLKNQGYSVSQAADGIEGLQKIESEEFHLAIVDIMMPRMDGITMMMKVREKGYEFPVIMLSAKIWCSMPPVFLSSTSSLEPERSSSGSCAISSCGRSK